MNDVQTNLQRYLDVKEAERRQRTMTWFDWDTHRQRVTTAEGLINGFGGKVIELRQTLADYKPEVVQAKELELFESTQQQVASQFADMRADVSKLLEKVEKAAALTVVPFDERSYWALATAQDLEGKEPATILAMYEKAIADGPEARRMEMERLAEPMIRKSGKPEHIERWIDLKISSRTPERANYAKLQIAAQAFEHGVQSMENHAAWILQESQQSQSPNVGTVALTTGFETFKGNVERSVSDLRAIEYNSLAAA